MAAVGSLWGPGGERGVYKTADGGKTWKHVLKGDEDTGANELVMDPVNNQILYASTYQRRRTACCMNGGGPGSGIWKSTDAGETWTQLKKGIPDEPMGRIAIDVSRKRPNILYALIEGQSPPPAARGGQAAPSGAEEGPGAQAAAAAPQAGPRAGAQQLNELPTGLYRSDDAGASWRKVNNANPRPMYFSKVRIDPTDPEVVYLGGVGLHQTLDGGKTMAADVAASTHDDVHAIWVNPANPNHIIIGNDGGLAYSYDMAKTWVFVPNLPLGLFYHVSFDMATPFNVCGGMQDNYSWCGPSAVRGTPEIANHHWTTIQGGDGFVVLQDPTDYRIAFSESQDGNIVRVDRVTGETMSIRPQPASGEPPLRASYDAFGSKRYVLSFDNRRVREIAAAAPYEFLAIIVNEKKYGGGGIHNLYVTSAADNAWTPYIFVHEFGHHLAGLADEYYSSAVAYESSAERPEPWEPNVTADSSGTRWRDMIAADTPLPTPWPKAAFESLQKEIQKRRRDLRANRRPESEMEALFLEEQKRSTSLFQAAPHAAKVGAFEGAMYEATGYYRPQQDCIMFSRNEVGFCAVCRRAIERVIDLYTAPR